MSVRNISGRFSALLFIVCLTRRVKLHKNKHFLFFILKIKNYYHHCKNSCFFG